MALSVVCHFPSHRLSSRNLYTRQDVRESLHDGPAVELVSQRIITKHASVFDQGSILILDSGSSDIFAYSEFRILILPVSAANEDCDQGARESCAEKAVYSNCLSVITITKVHFEALNEFSDLFWMGISTRPRFYSLLFKQIFAYLRPSSFLWNLQYSSHFA